MLKLHCGWVLAGDDLGHLTMAPQTINGEVLNMPSTIHPNALENSSSRRRGDQTFPHDDTTSAIPESEGAHFPTVLSRDSSQHLVGHAGIMANGNQKRLTTFNYALSLKLGKVNKYLKVNVYINKLVEVNPWMSAI